MRAREVGHEMDRAAGGELVPLAEHGGHVGAQALLHDTTRRPAGAGLRDAVVHGRRAPAHRVEKGVKLVGRVEASGCWQDHLLNDRRPRFKFPHHLGFFAEAIISDRRQCDSRLAVTIACLQRRQRQGIFGDLADDPLALSDPDELALFGWCTNHAGFYLSSVKYQIETEGGS